MHARKIVRALGSGRGLGLRGEDSAATEVRRGEVITRSYRPVHKPVLCHHTLLQAAAAAATARAVLRRANRPAGPVGPAFGFLGGRFVRFDQHQWHRGALYGIARPWAGPGSLPGETGHFGTGPNETLGAMYGLFTSSK